jgi:hypothetical protein
VLSNAELLADGCLYDDTDHDSAKSDETNVITMKNTLIFLCFDCIMGRKDFYEF